MYYSVQATTSILQTVGKVAQGRVNPPPPRIKGLGPYIMAERMQFSEGPFIDGDLLLKNLEAISVKMRSLHEMSIYFHRSSLIHNCEVKNSRKSKHKLLRKIQIL